MALICANATASEEMRAAENEKVLRRRPAGAKQALTHA
jgi:hypothetical protein